MIDLVKILADHKLWRACTGGSRANLSGAYLSRANLSRAYLSGTNLSGADLSRANLSGAYLSGTNLSGADLSRANLSRTNLSGADLSRANLSGAYLSGTNLSGADLSRANLSGAYLSGTNLSGADLSRANLSGADLSRADLSGTNLSRVNYGKTPIVDRLDAKILAAVESGAGSLDMSKWHTCETTHCRAGWAVTLAGRAGLDLERKIGSSAAGALIYAASTGRVPDFHCSDEEALADIVAGAYE